MQVFENIKKVTYFLNIIIIISVNGQEHFFSNIGRLYQQLRIKRANVWFKINMVPLA